MKYWVYFEAANFDATVYDVGDLSTIRGASHAYLEIPEGLLKHIGSKAIRQFQFSSACLFEVDAENEGAIDGMISRWVASGDQLGAKMKGALPELTFTWGITPSTGDTNFEADYKLVRNRSQEVRFQRLTIPARSAIDGSQGAESKRRAIGEKKLRPKFFERYGISVEKSLLASDFEGLVAISPDWVPAKLENKVAVIQFDVNNLGDSIPYDTPEVLGDASSTYEDSKKNLLHALTDTFLTSTDDPGLEILMWGGDEAVFIVPGWRFLDALRVLSDHLPRLTLGGGQPKLETSVGAVITDRRTPIRRVKGLLNSLVAETKQTSRERSLVQYVLTGMYEIPAQDLRSERKRLFGFSLDEGRKAMSLPLEQMGDIIRWLYRSVDKNGPCYVSNSELQSLLDVCRSEFLFPVQREQEHASEVWKEQRDRNGRAPRSDQSKLNRTADRVCNDAALGMDGKLAAYPFAAALHIAALRPFLAPILESEMPVPEGPQL